MVGVKSKPLRRGNKVLVRPKRGKAYWRALPGFAQEKEPLRANKKTPYDDLSIRELQAIGRSKQIYRTNHLTKEQLINQIKKIDQDPQSEEQLRKTLENRNRRRKEVLKAAPKGFQKEWNKINRVAATVRANPRISAILISAAIAGFTTRQYNTIRDEYRARYKQSAEEALKRAQQVNIDRTSKAAITFAVGGNKSTGSSGERIKEMLETPEDNSSKESWFKRKHHIIAFDHPDFDTEITSKQKNADGSYNPAYLGEATIKGAGKYLNNIFSRKKNDAAVDLAAKMYAYGQRYPDRQLNVVSHGVGGSIADEAMEILHRMRKQNRGDRTGQKIAEETNVVRLGGFAFGFNNSSFWKNTQHKTVTSAKDPASIFPKKASQWISGVMGGEVEDYLKNGDAREAVREGLGYYTSSLQNRGTSRSIKQMGEALEVAAKTLVPPLAPFVPALKKIPQMVVDNPTAAAITTGAVVTGASVVKYRQAQKAYNAGLAEAAAVAQNEGNIYNQRLLINDNPNYRKDLTFVVGGTYDDPQNIIDNWPDELKDKTALINTEVHGINHTRAPQWTKDLSADQWDVNMAVNGFGKEIMRNLALTPGDKPVDPEAVRLAALMYAHAQRLNNHANAQKNKNWNDFNFNVVATGDGGLKVRAAMDILNKIKLTGRNGEKKVGEAIASRINVVTFGTPDFDISKNEGKYREYGFVGDQDFFRLFPQKGSTMAVSGVGHTSKAYLKNDFVVDYLKKNIYNPAPKKQPPPKPKGGGNPPPKNPLTPPSGGNSNPAPQPVNPPPSPSPPDTTQEAANLQSKPQRKRKNTASQKSEPRRRNKKAAENPPEKREPYKVVFEYPDGSRREVKAQSATEFLSDPEVQAALDRQLRKKKKDD